MAYFKALHALVVIHFQFSLVSWRKKNKNHKSNTECLFYENKLNKFRFYKAL